MRRGGLFALAVLLCVVGLVAPACDGGLQTGGPEEDLMPNALEGLLPKPALPELTVTCGDRSVAGIRTGYSWTVDGESKGLEEVWPPPRASGKLLVTPGDSVAFTITFPQGSLGVATAKETVSARLSVWDWNAEHISEEPRPVYSGDCEVVELGPGSMSLSWAMPSMPALLQEGNSFFTRLVVKLGDSESSPWVSFVWNLVAADKTDLEEVEKIVAAYFDAVWANDESALSEVSPDWLIGAPPDFPPSSPLRAYLPGQREEIFWKSPSQAFVLASEPSIVVDDVRSSSYGKYADCRIIYEVEVRDIQSGATQRQAVSEEVRLSTVVRGRWEVRSASRRPERPQFGPPSITSRNEEFGTIVQVGPFGNVQSPYYGQEWSDDGDWFAFTGSSGGVKGIWAAHRDGSRLANLVGYEDTDVQLLDWVPGQNRVRFLSYGHHTNGPHADKTGYWVAEACLGTQEVRDIAFIRYPRVYFPRDVAVSQDHRYLTFKHSPDLWRVDMETGEVVRLADDIPSWDGLLVLRYSPSKRFTGYSEIGPSQPGFTLYDIATGEKRFIEFSGIDTRRFWAQCTGWTPRDEMMVLVCPLDEMNRGEGLSYPAAATAIRIYDPSGSLLYEIAVPEGDAGDRIGPVAWNGDGSLLAVAVGTLSEPAARYPYGTPEMRHQSKAVCIWTRSDGTLRKVGDISGEIESLTWAEDGKTVEAWFRPSDDQEVILQDGVKLGLDGVITQVQRTIPYRCRERETVVGALQDFTLVERFSPESGETLLVVPASGGSQETVVNDARPLRLEEPIITTGAAAVTGEEPDRYGEGAHWVYLVVLH
jgi:Tol biopolymer transport system component